MVFGLTWKRGL